MPFATFSFWLLLVWSLGWLALPISRRVWASTLLPDAGLAAGRILLLCLWTLSAFWLGFARVPVRFGALVIYLFAAFLLFFLWRERVELKTLLRNQRRGFIASELIFFAVFLFFFVVRGFWSSVENGEKPMDMALISAIARADYLPPPNPYAAGERLGSYYYLGHLQAALLTDAIGAQPRWTYNLMAATLPALCFSALASLCAALTGRIRYGAIAAFLILGCGTQEAWRQWTKRWLEARQGNASFSWWPINYWDTSRVIPYVDKEGPHFAISEYPWFSFNYADLHAHYFAQPLALLVLCLSWALFHHVRAGINARTWKIITVLGALVCGAQIMTNTWDVPAYFLLLFLSLGTLVLHQQNKAILLGRVVINGIGIGFLALLVAAPFLLKLHSEANPPRPLEQPASPWNEWLLVWGFFCSAWCLSMLAQSDAQARRKQVSLMRLRMLPLLLWGCFLLLSILLDKEPACVLSFLLMLFVWTLIYSILSDDLTHVFLCLVALCGLLALLWSETTWAGFLDKPNHRQDTVFKFGLQAWYLLGTASICGAIRLLHCWAAQQPLMLPFVRAGLAILLFAPLVATFSTTLARARAHLMSREETAHRLTEKLPDDKVRPIIFNLGAFGFYAEKWDAWDAWAHLKPAEQQTAQWLFDAARDGDNLLEAEQKEGGDYTEYSRYAHATGIPTVIGPQAHAFQWGVRWDKVFERKNDVRVFYLSGGLNRGAMRQDLMKKYGVRFIILGELEEQEYGTGATAWLERDLLHDGLPQILFASHDLDENRVILFHQAP
jgi:YYY domain-containing protein